MENVPSRPHPGRFFVLFAVSVTLTLVFAAAAGAQNETSGIPTGTAAQGSNPDNTSAPPDVITIAADCTVDEGASITVADSDGTEAVFTDGQQEIEIAGNGEVTITGPNDDYIGDHATFSGTDDDFDTNGEYTVVTSTSITCEAAAAEPQTDGEAEADQQSGGNADKQYEGEVIKVTIVKGLPKTGGPSPLLIPWVLAFVVVGITVLRRS